MLGLGVIWSVREGTEPQISTKRARAARAARGGVAGTDGSYQAARRVGGILINRFM